MRGVKCVVQSSIRLARCYLRGYRGRMIPRAIILVVLATLAVLSCKPREAIEVTETRVLTMWDTQRDPLIAPMPPEWRKVPSTQHRLFNYRFGEGADIGEVYISRARGGILPNANRWMKQFDKPEFTTVDDLPTVKLLNMDGVVVSATGRFGGGMGKPARENAAVLGVIAGGADSLITVKMIGPADLVSAERERLLKFCKNLRLRKTVEARSVSSDSEE